MASKASTLTSDQRTMLTTLFELLDDNKDGKLQLEEFKALGKALTGKEVTTAEARAQMTRADKDRNDVLDLEEWLEFGAMLAVMPPDKFSELMNTYIASVTALKKKEKAAKK